MALMITDTIPSASTMTHLRRMPFNSFSFDIANILLILKGLGLVSEETIRILSYRNAHYKLSAQNQ
jgi:sulfite exporter TauE/SafE